MRRSLLFAFLPCGVAVALGACSRDDARRAEASRLVDTLSALDVAAPMERRQTQVAALRNLVLHDAELLRVRDQCLTVHAGLLAAEREQAAATRTLQEAAAKHAGQGLPPGEADRVTQAIARSERAWATAHAALPACEAATRELVLHKR